MVIYTRRGDKGKTSLFDENSSQRIRVSKNSPKVKALGAIDELNSFLGICVAFSENPELTQTLKEIQKNLLTIGSILAGSNLRFSKVKTKHLEGVIDELEGSLPVLKNFIIPGGTKLASLLQYLRTLARRAERRVVALPDIQNTKPHILSYVNRLSDFLFMLAREQNFKLGIKDEIWTP